MFHAVVEGYKDRMFDLDCLAVQQGYWAAYYQGKHPKSVVAVLNQMLRDHRKQSKKNGPKPDVDVELYKQREERFKQLYKKG